MSQSRSHFFRILLLLVVSANLFCVTMAKKPELNKTASIEERKISYEKNKINKSEKLFGGYIIDNKEYENGALKPLFTDSFLSAEVRDNWSMYNGLTITSGVFGGVAGACLGWNIGTLAAGGETEPVLWGVGAGTLAVGIIISCIADSYLDDAVKGYNIDLKTELNIADQAALQSGGQYPVYGMSSLFTALPGYRVSVTYKF
ncbi:MAG: hypothetical protein GY754_42435 [bacterium]|nr:hypothetical protein [bacterium]